MTAEQGVVPPRATGRVVGPVRASYLVLESIWTWYRRNWKATIVSSVGLPVLYLIAMGVGFGSQVRSTASLGGMSYVAYLAPALLAAGAIQTAVGECTYPILSGFKWQKIYQGITATPITPGQLANGLLVWVASRLVISGVAYLVVAVLIGAVTGPGIVLSLLAGLLTGMAFGALVMAFSAAQYDDGSRFNPLFRFVVVPMSLFAGTFFPVTQLPVWVRPVAWITPLWHGTELARGAEFGTLGPLAALGHTAYLVALLVAGILLSRWRFRVRLTS
jgi:lipooligosaccharide transport system permease protein